MRHFGMATAAVMAAMAPGAVLADTITFSEPISIIASGPYPGDITVAAPGAFSPSLGALTGETLVLSGTFTPGHEWPCCSLGLLPGQTYPASVPVTLRGQVGLSPVHTSIFLADENLEAIGTGNNSTGGPGAYIAIGTPEAFTITNPLPAADFNPYQIVVSAGSRPLDWEGPPVGPGDPFDLMQLHATLSQTFIYTPAGLAPLPEPASLALLGFGVLGLGMMRRKR